MDTLAQYELYMIGILTVATVWLTAHTVRYYRAKRKLLKHMQRFAKEGDADAGLFVADEYRKGDVVKKSCERALFWYNKAALEGNEEAKRYLEEYRKQKRKRC